MAQAVDRWAPTAQAPREMRFEFRCWPSGRQLEAIRQAVSGWKEEEAEQRTDLYLLLVREHDILPKLRHRNTFEVKRRLGAADRIELWGLSASSRFPLQDSVRDWLVRDAGFAPCAARLWSQTAHALRTQIAIEPGWEALEVTKTRRLFTRGHLRGEITQMSCAGRVFDTAAFESQDLPELRAQIDALPFSGLANRNYGDFLRDLLGR